MIQRVFAKYSIMRMRQKISFTAFINNQTVLQCFANTILRSYNFLKETKQLP